MYLIQISFQYWLYETSRPYSFSHSHLVFIGYHIISVVVITVVVVVIVIVIVVVIVIIVVHR